MYRDEWGGFDAYKNVRYFFDNASINEDNQAIILENIIRINQYDNFKKTLVIGEVQSGKTNNLISSAFLEIDKGTNLVITLGGTNNKLFNQFKDRLDDAKGMPLDFIVATNNNIEYQNILSNLKTGRTIIWNVLKNVPKLEKVKKLVNKLSSDSKIVIIDDESDFASINKNGKVNKIISDMLEQNESVRYIGFTATPYANLMSDSNLEPDVLIKLKRSPEYTGIGFFSNKSIYQEALGITDLEKVEYYVDDFLYRSFYANALGFKNVQGLINIDVKIDEHKTISDYCKKHLKEKFIWIMNNSKLLKEDIAKYLELDDEGIDMVYDHIMMPEKREKMSPFDVEILNGNSGESKDNDSILDNDANTIIIGGVILSRGVTFERLISELLVTREDKQPLDILLQKSRWFGYRKEIVENNIMKIFGYKNFVNKMNEAIQVNDLLYNNLLADYETNNIKQVINKLRYIESELKYIKLSDKSEGRTINE